MGTATTELYEPRHLSNMGKWRIGSLDLKVYGIAASGRHISDEMIDDARQQVKAEIVELVASFGGSNDVGFAIFHAGSEGATISTFWWAMGDLLCRHKSRQPYGSLEAVDLSRGPAIACVWELAVIAAERDAWRDAMMSSRPNRDVYMEVRANFNSV